ncbi:hypothetical protein PPYR_00890 [Photinus pyralis]|uniref:Peptidase M28 domain-containing protein n=1 Tax=Photinus pyralis TaxID=7054 RepID=A0A1Y1KUH2_PHOPY|nr:hypothetical protein PPYR_00890 [Photinus pyralis]
MHGGGDDPSEHYAANRHTVPPVIAIIFIMFIFSLYGIVYLIDGIFPNPLYIIDEKDNPAAFIAERVQQDLKEFTEIGPRIIGSYENEVTAVDYLRQKIQEVKQEANAVQKMEVDEQVASGSYLVDKGFVSVYDKVQNVLVKLHSSNHSRHTLLINAHFDSAPGTSGAGDNGVNCATMLELLRKLS